MGAETVVQFCLYLIAVDEENGCDAVVNLRCERHNLAFTLHDEPYCHGLHTSCRERRLDLSPQDRREIEAHKTVQHTACLLCVGQVHVQSAGLFYGLQDGFLCYLMEDDTVGVGLVKTQYLAKVP